MPLHKHNCILKLVKTNWAYFCISILSQKMLKFHVSMNIFDLLLHLLFVWFDLQKIGSYYLWWLFLVTKLTASGIKYNSEIEPTPTKHVLPGLKWKDLFLVWTFEIERHMPSIWILRQEDILLVWALPSAGNLCIKTWKKEV